MKKILYFSAICLAVFLSIQAYIILGSRSAVTEDENNLEPAEAALVLGARVYSDTELSPVLKDRCDYAIRLLKDGIVKQIIVSGSDAVPGKGEVRAMRNYIQEKGVTSDLIIDDDKGVNTMASMRNAYALGYRDVIICTQKFHSYRSVYLAKTEGLKAQAYAAQDKAIYNMPWNHFRESLARVKALITTKVKWR